MGHQQRPKIVELTVGDERRRRQRARQLLSRQALAVAHGADLIGLRLQHRTGIENIHRAAPAETLFLEDRPRRGGIGMHLTDDLAGRFRQQ